jgi:lipoprotein-releasing system ATP-binding protein
MKRQATLGVAVIDDTQFRAATGSGELVRVEGLRKVYHSGSQEITPLDGITFSIERGEMISIVGPSGAGKSTLLHILAALDTPTNGTVYFGASSLESLNEAELAEYRSRTVGFVWQRHHLLPDFTAGENVAMPMLVRGEPMAQSLRAAQDWLGEVGLGDRAAQRAGELSGGEQQRVAIARALANRPALLLADEPTGDLDERSAESVFELMKRLHRSHQLTSILATHNLSLARRTDRILVLDHGKLAPAGEVPTASTQTIAWTAGVGAETPGDPNRV